MMFPKVITIPASGDKALSAYDMQKPMNYLLTLK